MTADDRNQLLRGAMTAVRDCAETMEAQAARLLQALLRLPMDEGLRARAMERVDRLKDASGRVMFELALLRAEAGEGKAEAAKVVARLTGMDAVMMDALATLTDVVAELEKAAERDEAKEPAYVRVIEAMGVLLQGLKTAKAATETLAATVPWALQGIPPQLPVRAAADGSVVVLQAGAEGGDVTLIGQTTVAGAWSFARVTDDQTEALFGDSGVEITPPPALKPEDWVDGWDEGLRLMDRYQWARLHPLYVHPAFMERVRAAVEERLADVDSESAERAREKWERLLQQP
jgi:hypothetical protein